MSAISSIKNFFSKNKLENIFIKKLETFSRKNNDIFPLARLNKKKSFLNKFLINQGK
jgi:hypothetical protein